MGGRSFLTQILFIPHVPSKAAHYDLTPRSIERHLLTSTA